MTRLFDDFAERDDIAPASRRSEFAYLNSSGIAMAGVLRAFLEVAFDRYTGDKTHLRTRFRSPINAQHTAAAYELLLHELSWRRGCAPLADAEVEGGKVDLQLRLRDGDRAWLEARMLNDGENVHFSRVRDIVDVMTRPGVQLELEMTTPLTRAVNERKLKTALGAYLEALDAVPNETADGSFLAKPFIYEEEGVHLLKVVARLSLRYGDSVISHVPDQEMPTTAELLNGLTRKAKKYRALEGPYIIALCTSKMFVCDDMFEDALFAERENLTGLWARGRNARVSAVLACDGFKPSSLNGAEVKLFHNPSARYPLRENPFGCEEVWREEGRLVRSATVPLSEILGLPSDWLSAA